MNILEEMIKYSDYKIKNISISEVNQNQNQIKLKNKNKIILQHTIIN